jgi:light-regulated signal transduction histidine kinase (bacteriophytochrome)
MRKYLVEGGEDALVVAYEVGRKAMAEGLGLLDVMAMHEDALEANVLAALDRGVARNAHSAGEFCRELLSPFEMGMRGYQVANDHLRRLNEVLLEQKQALEAVNQELESFSYSVSHDLRAPLRSIDGFSQALLEDYGEKLDEQGRKYLGYVRQSAQQMSALIDDLLELARVTRSEFARSEVDLSKLARVVVDRLRRAEPERRVEVVVEEGLVASGDARLLELVLQNLLGNAWKFTSKTDRAHIEFRRSEAAGPRVYRVADNGAGFDMSYATKLFGVFQRLHSAREFEGTGVGLATVQRIVRRHGGDVWAEGEVGRGATLYFTLEGGAR